MLDLLGLDATSEAVYRTMLSRPQALLPEVAAAVGLAEDEVRRTLDRLAELSLLRPSWEHSDQLRPISPEIGLEVLLARQQAELAAHQQRIEESRAAAASLIAQFADASSGAAGAGGGVVEQLTGLDNIRDRLAELTRQVKYEVCAFSPSRGLSEDNVAAARPLDEQLLRRGVTMRTIYLESAGRHSTTLEYARRLTALGAEVRTAPSLPVRMTLIDGRIAVIPANPDNSAAAAVVLHGRGVVAALTALFDEYWRTASPLSPARARDSRGLTSQEREVLQFLAAGHTDESIGKRLGVSVRTAGRIASELMARLGAASRFQAGYRLAQAGWLDAPSAVLSAAETRSQ
ncbi:LuxR C-terminal-related transcriptional regulator [Streptomyces sp. NPDC059761]|uniref:LuxR C-terminal-related transcriptional regulator n=1 Tax=Streptomyces sp. NPDC059761 TaxID=3346937 RepID=UPI0036644CA0